VVKRSVELVDGLGPERVAHLGTVESHPDRALVDCSMVGDVLELEAVHHRPAIWVEQLRHLVRT
jgi:hypothetical protein